MAFLHYWRMPMLYFISGVGTYFALGKRGTWKYVVERHKRLFIPLVFGILILVAPQVYMERIDQYNSYFDFYPHFFEGVYPTGNFSWHHLWFIVYLLIFSMLALPIFLFMKSKHGLKVYRFLEKILSIKGGFGFLFIPILISQIILRPYFPEETHALINDWAFFTYNFIYFIYGFILLSDKKLVGYIFEQRHINFIIGILFTISMFAGTSFFATKETRDIFWNVNSMLMSWFLPLSFLGYAQKNLNIDNKIRKHANEAIYPIYLLHQPIILIIGYYIKDWQIAILLKATFLIVTSLISILIFYLIIRELNVLRFIFGMHLKKKKELKTEVQAEIVQAA